MVSRMFLINAYPWVMSAVRAVATLILLTLAHGNVLAATDAGSVSRPNAKHAWSVSLDNDLFAPLVSSDKDFTGGMALTYSSGGDAKYWRPLDRLQSRFDRFMGIREPRAVTTSMEFGVYGFTPDDTRSVELVSSDRPYASLVYLSSSRMYALSSDSSVSTSLTWGLLGTDIFGDMQRGIHRAIDNAPVRGWHNQISDGGELTARYQVAYHKYWQSDDVRSRLKTTLFSSVGYLTEAGVALSTRRGLISSPDHRFNPELISYGERVTDTVAMPFRGKENYFWGGVALKGRLYNAFLQGQFRDSAHTLEYRDLRPMIGEAWLGYTFTIGRQFRASYVIRAHTSEIRTGKGDRGHLWGSLILSRYL